MKSNGSGEVERLDGVKKLTTVVCANPWKVYDCWEYLPKILETLSISETSPRNPRSLDRVEGGRGGERSGCGSQRRDSHIPGGRTTPPGCSPSARLAAQDCEALYHTSCAPAFSETLGRGTRPVEFAVSPLSCRFQGRGCPVDKEAEHRSKHGRAVERGHEAFREVPRVLAHVARVRLPWPALRCGTSSPTLEWKCCSSSHHASRQNSDDAMASKAPRSAFSASCAGRCGGLNWSGGRRKTSSCSLASAVRARWKRSVSLHAMPLHALPLTTRRCPRGWTGPHGF